MMINCEKAGEIIDQKDSSEKVSGWNKMRLKMHTSMCKLCKQYEADSSVMGKIIKMVASKTTSNCVSNEEKEKMKKKLSES